MKLFLLFPFLAFFAVSCTVSNPATRIEDNPKLYTSLSPRQQALVQNGKIENGMNPRTVFLAWGHPNSKSEGQENGKTFEKWTYTGLTPVYSQSIYGGLGYGYRGFGRRGRYRGFYPYNSFSTEINYVPYRVAWVKFQNGRVESWQRGRRE